VRNVGFGKINIRSELLQVNRAERREQIGAQMHNAEARFLDPGDALVVDGERISFKAELAGRLHRSRYLGKRDHEVVLPANVLASKIAEGGLRAIGRIEVHPAVGKALAERQSFWVVRAGLDAPAFEVGNGRRAAGDHGGRVKGFAWGLRILLQINAILVEGYIVLRGVRQDKVFKVLPGWLGAISCLQDFFMR